MTGTPEKAPRLRAEPIRLGIVLLDGARRRRMFGRFGPADAEGLSPSQAGLFACPASWSVPTAYAVAPGATAATTLEADPVAGEGLATAVRRLAPVSDLVISDCGFFWGVRDAVPTGVSTPMVLSGLDLLGLAAAVTDRPIGVLTFSSSDLEPIVESHPSRHRLRLVGMSDEPAWRQLAPEFCDDETWSAADLDQDALCRDLMRVVTRSVEQGPFHDIGALILECTVMPQYRPELRRRVRAPIFDAASAVSSLTGASLRTYEPRGSSAETQDSLASRV